VLLYRVIENEGEPVWDEINAMLVGPLEVHADENLRLQLWDSGESAPPFPLVALISMYNEGE
jgi:hypothetical protein